MLNAVWLMRGRSIKDTREGMHDYLANRKTELEEKYRRDYVDKYKLSLMFLLSSHERKDKLYYSFNTYCFLSSGIVGNFLELCRRAFQIAAFENREALLEGGQISPKLQNMAAREVGKSELDMIRRIPEYGIELSHFANSLGNCFRTYHQDPRLRYPETNQLSVDLSTVPSEEDRSTFEAAIRWSVIQRKPRLQGPNPGGGKTEIYTLNRILAPVFQISYRTRGGKSETIPGDRLSQCFFVRSCTFESRTARREQEDIRSPSWTSIPMGRGKLVVRMRPHVYKKEPVNSDGGGLVNVDCLIVAAGSDDRGLDVFRYYARSGGKASSAILLEFDERTSTLTKYEHEAQCSKFDIETLPVVRLEGVLEEPSTFIAGLTSAGIRSAQVNRVGVDMTLFTRPFLFWFLKYLNRALPEPEIFVYYTEPRVLSLR